MRADSRKRGPCCGAITDRQMRASPAIECRIRITIETCFQPSIATLFGGRGPVRQAAWCPGVVEKQTDLQVYNHLHTRLVKVALGCLPGFQRGKLVPDKTPGSAEFCSSGVGRLPMWLAKHVCTQTRPGVLYCITQSSAPLLSLEPWLDCIYRDTQMSCRSRL